MKRSGGQNGSPNAPWAVGVLAALVVVLDVVVVRATVAHGFSAGELRCGEAVDCLFDPRLWGLVLLGSTLAAVSAGAVVAGAGGLVLVAIGTFLARRQPVAGRVVQVIPPAAMTALALLVLVASIGH